MRLKKRLWKKLTPDAGWQLLSGRQFVLHHQNTSLSVGLICLEFVKIHLNKD